MGFLVQKLLQTLQPERRLGFVDSDAALHIRQATNAIPDSSFIALGLSTTPSQPIGDGLNATNQAILTAQYACQQYELNNPSAAADCNWLANPLVAADNQSGAATATASTTMTASN